MSSLATFAAETKTQDSVLSVFGEGGKFTSINLDRFIEKQRPLMPGTKTIVAPHNVEFTATLKSNPEKVKVSYLYMALSTMNVDPMPKANYRMFVESQEGNIIPVYVEDASVKMIDQKTTLDQAFTFKGYHVYNYSKGPAMVITGIK